jgi:4-amino-4-deoxy-L-arabinose transferase-like glycosyltransferase
VAPGEGCALRVPAYPLFLSPFASVGWVYPGAVIAQALVGGALVWLAWLIGRELFDDRVGLFAAALASLSPYAVMHDTALQETVVANTFMAAGLLLLLRARRTGRARLCLAAGIVLALATLTAARFAIFLPCALAWLLLAAGKEWHGRIRRAALLVLPMIALVGGWMLRNSQVVGGFVLTSEAGESLWKGNNPSTFSHYPTASIDLSAIESFERLRPAARAELERLEGQEVARDRLYRRWAVEYIAADPGRTVRAAMRKLAVMASAQFSPARGPAIQWGYLIMFLPLHVLALAGAWSVRRQWQVHALTALLVGSFAVTTAAFWAHTSHKSYLDVFLFVYASAGGLALVDRGRSS